MAGKFKYKDENFPILFDNGTIQVYTNGCGEIFVEHLGQDIRFRVTPDPKGLNVTSHVGRLTPWAVNGLPAFRVSKN